MSKDLVEFLDIAGRPTPVGARVHGVSRFGMRFDGVVERIVQGRNLNVFIRRGTGGLLVILAEYVEQWG